ncbi:MAG: cytidine deaminase [Ignavibacteria bacterium]|nr:cytidine deaminase [Ignavibacteria bacterium]
MKNNYKQLTEEAKSAKQFSHSPYSHFRVGAAVLTKSGKIFSGTNVENSSYSLTICAERTALFKAISEGEKKFSAIAISTDQKEFISPCGACRQVIMDLAGNIDVILSNNNGKTKSLKMKELLPHAFGEKYLKKVVE